ncbi:MAG: response regulator [Bdellovibrionales bacterium]|nr:response regulator [Bdellovibrionales bacterium]
MQANEIEQLPGNPLILYVDDEALLREVASIMIEDFGGRCLLAVDGNDAVEKFAEQADDIDFVYIDYSMPNMNGHETIVELRKIRADIPICVVSGLDITPEIEELHKRGEIGFLSKPFREKDLLTSYSEYRKK